MPVHLADERVPAMTELRPTVNGLTGTRGDVLCEGPARHPESGCDARSFRPPAPSRQVTLTRLPRVDT